MHPGLSSLYGGSIMSAKRKMEPQAAPAIKYAQPRVASRRAFIDRRARPPARQYRALRAVRLQQPSISKYPLAARLALVGGGSVLIWGLIITATVAALN